MPPVASTQGNTVTEGDSGVRYGPALTLLASLFFMWGFITVINNTLLPHLRSVFDLNYTQTTLIESVWFIAYFVASIPSAKLIEKIGYQKSLVIGLLVMAAGALGMMLAASIPSYGVTLAMLFVIASGITLLKVAANPYVTRLGPVATASSRLNLTRDGWQKRHTVVNGHNLARTSHKGAYCQIAVKLTDRDNFIGYQSRRFFNRPIHDPRHRRHSHRKRPAMRRKTDRKP